MGNGTEETKEGFKFRGRGYIQLTGKDNYTAFAKAINEDTVANPDDGSPVSATIRHLHTNLEHPEPRALARAIRLPGGRDTAIREALRYRCLVCSRLQEPCEFVGSLAAFW